MWGHFTILLVLLYDHYRCHYAAIPCQVAVIRPNLWEPNNRSNVHRKCHCTLENIKGVSICWFCCKYCPGKCMLIVYAKYKMQWWILLFQRCKDLCCAIIVWCLKILQKKLNLVLLPAWISGNLQRYIKMFNVQSNVARLFIKTACSVVNMQLWKYQLFIYRKVPYTLKIHTG